MSNNLQIYSFEGRYEINDENGKRWFEVTQSSVKQAFLYVGEKRKFDSEGNYIGMDPVFKQLKYSRPITDVLERIKEKLDQGYERVGGIDVLEHDKCNYNKSPEVIKNYKKGLNIIKEQEGVNFFNFLEIKESNNKKIKAKKVNKDYLSAIPKDSMKELFGA